MPLSVRPGMKPFEWAFAVTVTSLLMVAMRKKRKTKRLMYEFLYIPKLTIPPFIH